MATPDPYAMLRRACRERGISKSELARRLGRNLSTVWKWLRPEREKRARPDLLSRRQLAAMFGIPEDAWLTANERRAFARAADLAATGTDD